MTDDFPPLSSLKCRRCGEFAADAKTLSCLHTFCAACVRDMRSEQLVGREKELAAVNADRRARGLEPLVPETGDAAEAICCDYCVNGLGLPATVRSVPFDNLRVQRIVSIVKDTKVICSNCDNRISSFRCKTCDAVLCGECLKSTHSAPMFKNHQIEEIDRTDLIRKLPKCKTHTLNDLEFFSTADEVGVCQVCLLKGEFVGKPYTLVSELKQKRAQGIESQVAKVQAQRLRLTSARQEAENVKKELHQNVEAQASAVRENFAAIRSALDIRQQQTLDALSALKEAKCRVLDVQIKTITNALTKMDTAAEEGNIVLKYSNDLEYVYNSFVIEDYMSELSDISSTAPSSCEECASSGRQCHCPVVDAELPVIISDKVPSLVSAYAAVPSAEMVDELLSSPSKGHAVAKQAMNAVGASDAQRAILSSVASDAVADNADEYGCVVC